MQYHAFKRTMLPALDVASNVSTSG